MNGPLRKDDKKSSPLNGQLKKEVLAIGLAILIALLVILITSTGHSTVNETSQPANQATKIPTKIYAAGGIYLEYPYSWNITADGISGNNMQLMIQDPTSASNPNSTQAAGFTVLKVQKDPYETLEQRKESFIQNLKNSGANIAPSSSVNTTVNGINAIETIYNGKGPKDEQIQLKLIYFEQGNIFYMIAFLTKGMDLESQKANFDVVLNSFKLQ